MNDKMFLIAWSLIAKLRMDFTVSPTLLHQICDEIAQMIERRTVELEVLGSNPIAGEFFHAMLQHVTSDRVYKIPTKRMYNWISVYTVQLRRW